MNSIARIASVLFHPLFMVTYFTLLILWKSPYAFAGMDTRILVGNIVINTVFFPLLAITLLYKLEFIPSLKMENHKDRIGPMMAIIVFYVWTYLLIKKSGTPLFLSTFLLGVLISIFFSFLVNIFQKLSLHMVGTGGLLAGILFLYIFSNIELNLILLLTVILCGVVASARMILGAHTLGQVYIGFVVGVIGQMAAFSMLL